jgi:hypothetical protein
MWMVAVIGTDPESIGFGSDPGPKGHLGKSQLMIGNI